MDAELVAISKALKYLQSRNTTGKTIYICADSQAALKRLEKTARTGGQELTYDITQACKALQSAHNIITFVWVPGHCNIHGNDHADKLAKAGLKGTPQKPYTSLSHLATTLRKNTINKWKSHWTEARDAAKGKSYAQATRNAPRITMKAFNIRYPRKTQASFYQLLLGKGFFKSFSYTIGKDEKGECFGSCTAFQSPKHLILHCKHYAKERKSMRKELGSTLTLSKLFTTTNGKKALLSYLNKTEIATAQWLLTAGQPDS